MKAALIKHLRPLQSGPCCLAILVVERLLARRRQSEQRASTTVGPTAACPAPATGKHGPAEFLSPNPEASLQPGQAGDSGGIAGWPRRSGATEPGYPAQSGLGNEAGHLSGGSGATGPRSPLRHSSLRRLPHRSGETGAARQPLPGQRRQSPSRQGRTVPIDPFPEEKGLAPGDTETWW